MSNFRIRRPSAALVVSVVALIAALGGTSYAAFSLPKNSVGTKQLKNGAVTTQKIKNGGVTASKLDVTGVTVPGALHANHADTAANAINATDAMNATNASHATSATNAANATNATNATDAASANSANALQGVKIVFGTNTDNPANSQNGSIAICPSGTHAIGGGVEDSGGLEQAINDDGITTSTATDDSYFADVNNTSSGITAVDDSFQVWATCINGSVSGAAHRGALRK